MEKKGVTAGVLLIAGVLLRPLGLLPSRATSEPGDEAPAASARVQPAPDEGPWIASCRYWAPTRPQPGAAGATASRSEPGQEVATDSEADSGCGMADRWGIPSPVDGRKPQITAMIAAVPDPLRAHMALQFDRTIDALVQAAADNGYLESYFWIPWRPQTDSSQDADGTGQESGKHGGGQQRQPGLIVLKATGAAYWKVMYLFLVRNTPVLGMDGSEFSAAVAYEKELRQRSDVSVLLSPKNSDEFEVIGSNASGSAASLREAITAAAATLKVSAARVAGTTSTDVPEDIFSRPSPETSLTYTSFGNNTPFERKQWLTDLVGAGYDPTRAAFLVEDATAYGDATAQAWAQASFSTGEYRAPVIRFPRGISLLRNARSEQDKSRDTAQTQSPYLYLSLADNSIEDTVPHFSSEHTPVSQEAQLLAISRQLHRLRTQFVVITASDVLDEIFLAKFLHRAMPDLRFVSLGGGDLLFEREIDNVPFIGEVTITPYNLVAPVSSGSRRSGSPVYRAFPDAASQALYNAASYIFWNPREQELRLANYRSLFGSQTTLHPMLWATVIGRDGYYPLGIVNECASDSAQILPAFPSSGPGNGASSPDPQALAQGQPCQPGPANARPAFRFAIAPSLSWFMLCFALCGTCLLHMGMLGAANLWSPFTRDLAIRKGAEPCRRSLYIHIGATMLFCMSFVAAYPFFPTLLISRPVWRPIAVAAVTVFIGLITLVQSFVVTSRFVLGSKPATHRMRLCRTFYLIACAAAILLPLLWCCSSGGFWNGDSSHHEHLFFSYRCLNPFNGVAPSLPILLLLTAWYLWSIFQSRRLRFSEANRPRLPHTLSVPEDDYFFVTDETLTKCRSSQQSCLLANITSLLITPEVLNRFLPEMPRKVIERLLLGVYLLLFFVCVFLCRIDTPERIFWKHPYLPTPYEFLVQLLFYPLMMITLTGWLRIILVWGALNRTILRQLELRPIRFAFNRLNGLGWMALMRQSGLVQHWREMARSTEAMRQMRHLPGFEKVFALPEGQPTQSATPGTDPDRYTCLMRHIDTLLLFRNEESHPHTLPWSPADEALRERFRQLHDIPDPAHEADLLLVYLIENDYAEFAHSLLVHILIPFWKEQRSGFVENDSQAAGPAFLTRSPETSGEPANKTEDGGSPRQTISGTQEVESQLAVQLAEEFLAIRYLSVIRAVLVNLRHLMAFVSCAFVLTIVSWNSYSFRPREWVDGGLTVLLLLVGGVVIWVFAQIHRDPILSRVTRTEPNELGAGFFLRIAGFGAAPVLTWLAYQFPSISEAIFRYLQPGIEASLK